MNRKEIKLGGDREGRRLGCRMGGEPTEARRADHIGIQFKETE